MATGIHVTDWIVQRISITVERCEICWNGEKSWIRGLKPFTVFPVMLSYELIFMKINRQM